MPLDKTLLVAAVTGRGDPAFDRAHPDHRAALVRYARTRSAADLAKVPLRPGMQPRLYGVAVLTAHARSVVLDAPGPAERAVMAVRAGVVSVRHPDGQAETPAYDAPAGDLGRFAPAAWAEKLAERGAYVVDELASVVLHRAEFGDHDEAEGADPLVPCELPRGARLAV